MWFEQINPLSPDGVHTYDRLVVLNDQNMNLTLTLNIGQLKGVLLYRNAFYSCHNTRRAQYHMQKIILF